MRAKPFTKTLVLLILMLFILIIFPNYSLAKADEAQELRSGLLELNKVKEEMGNAGMGITRISDLITEGFLYFNNKNYDKTREIVSAVYELRDDAFNTKKEFSVVNKLWLDIKEKNISLINTTATKLEWSLEYAQREFEKENYKGAQRALDNTKKALLNTIDREYGYLNASLSMLEKKISLLELGQAGIITLKSLLSEALGIGMLEELEIIKQEITYLNQSLIYYEEINLIIPVLENKGLSSKRILDELRAAELDLSFGDYKSSSNRLESLIKLVQDALKLEQEMRKFEKKVDDEKAMRGTEITEMVFKEAELLLVQAKQELVLGNYEEAEQRLISAKNSFESSKAELLVRRAGSKSIGITLKEFIEKNWLYILLAIIIILIVLKFTYKTLSYKIRKRRFARMKKEIMVNENMVKELQRNYFIHKKMTRESYDEAYESLQEKIMSLKEKISLLNKKIEKRGVKKIKKKETKKKKTTEKKIKKKKIKKSRINKKRK